MPSVAIDTSTQTPAKGEKIPRGNKSDPGFKRAKRLAERGMISPKAMAVALEKMKIWDGGE